MVGILSALAPRRVERIVTNVLGAFIVLLLVLAAPATAKHIAVPDSDEAAHGREIAASWCSACHQVGPYAEPREDAPSFMALSERPYLTPQFIFDWIAENNHPVMPAFNMPADDREKVAAYIVSLSRPETLAHGLNEFAPAAGASDRDRSTWPTQGSSTGFFVSHESHIVTVAHGVQSCQRMTVLYRGRQSPARFIGADVENDIAVVQGEGSHEVAYLRPDDRIVEGDRIASYGYPLPAVLSRQGVMGFGHVNAVEGPYGNRNKMQVDIPAYPGSSGSPVFDGSGRVIGMITGRINRQFLADRDRHYIATLTFAAKASAIRRLLARHGIDVPRPGETGIPVARAKDAAVRLVCYHFPL